MEFRLFVVLIVGLIFNCYDTSWGSEDEERLVKDLFSRYNRLIRPVNHMNETVYVQFTLILSLLINVQEKEQVMKTNVWLDFRWRDPQMIWDPANYGGIQSIRLPVDKIWIPDIVLINNADGKYTESYKSNVVVYSSGDLLWLPPSIYKSTCDIRVQWFPFDEQICDMKFQSWTYNAHEVMLGFRNNDNQVDISGFLQSGTWDYIKAPGFLNVYPQAKNGTVNITYRIIIRRKTLFYTVNLLIPTVLVSFLSVLVFYLPTVAGEKVALSISILLTLNVFLLLVSKLLPPASDLPLIGKYLLFTFLMNLVSIVITVITININFRSPKTHKMPPWIRRLFLEILPTLLLMRRPRKVRRKGLKSVVKDSQRSNHRPENATNYNRSASPGPADSYLEGMEMSEIRSNDTNLRRTPSRGLPTSASMGFNTGRMTGYANRPYSDRLTADSFTMHRANLEREDPEDFSLTSPDARLVTSSIQSIVQHHLQNDALQEVEEDWKYVALVIDRLLLWIFFIATTVGSFMILLSADTIFESLDEARRKPYFE